MGSAGCLLNPSIENTRQLAELILPYTDLHGFQRVETMAFTCHGYETYFAPEIKVRCYRVPRPPRSISEIK